jgi:hypothetical protein
VSRFVFLSQQQNFAREPGFDQTIESIVLVFVLLEHAPSYRINRLQGSFLP